MEDDWHKPTNLGWLKPSSWLSPQSLLWNFSFFMPSHEHFHPILFQFISGCCGDQSKWNFGREYDSKVICDAGSHANSISILFDYGNVEGINSRSFCHHCILKEKEEKNLQVLADTDDLYCWWIHDFWMHKALRVSGIFNLMAMGIAPWKGPFPSLLSVSAVNRLPNGQDSGFNDG